MVAASTSNYSADCWLQYVESLDRNPLCDQVRMVQRCHITQQCTPQLTVVVLEKAPSRSIELGHSSSGVVCCSLLSLQFPTFLDLAGVQAEEDLDGRSLKSIFLGEEEEATVRV